MSTKPVVVYGVSGYTGRLVCEYLREYNIPSSPPAATRPRCRRWWTRSPASRRPTTRWSASTSSKGADQAVQRRRSVSNMVGPFIKYGSEVVEAALAAGCHYTDLRPASRTGC